MGRTARGTVEQGWSVEGSDGSSVGEVVGATDATIVVRSGTLLKHELYVPVSEVERIEDGRVVLRVSGGDADSMGWRQPPGEGLASSGIARPVMDADRVPDAGTTMTGAGYGAGYGASSGGPLAPGHGDALGDRLGGSGRAGLSGFGDPDRGPDDGTRVHEEGSPGSDAR